MDFFQGISLIIVGAITLEGIIETIKNIFVEKEIKIWKIISMVLGIGISLAFGLNIMSVLGFSTQTKFLGEVITGILISRGSNFINDFLQKIEKVNS